jgi:predicted peroxiredoxin
VRGVTGLSIVVAGRDPARFRTALTLAAASAALGGRTRILLNGESVRMAADTSNLELLESCFALGVAITLCQSGLAEAGLETGALDARFDYGGMVGFLAELGADRLVVA